MSHLEQCIYCRVLSKPSREHVLAKNLGGNLTTLCSSPFKPVVCDGCNRSFGRIDQALAERSTIALHRVTASNRDAADVKLGDEHFLYDEARNRWLEAQLRSGLKPRILPQLHRKDGKLILIGAAHDERIELVELIGRLRDARKLMSVHIKVDSSPEVSSSRLAMHREKAVYVRAASIEAGQDFLRLLDANWPTYAVEFLATPTSAEPIPQLEVNIRLAIQFDDCNRAIAKSAFTFMAVQLGGDFALRHEFDPIRDYIRGLNIQHPEDLGPNEVAVDPRFVEAWDETQAPLISTDFHAIGLFYAPQMLFGLVTLYAANTFVVRLAPISLQEPVAAFHEFSLDGTWNTSLDMFEMARRIRESTRS